MEHSLSEANIDELRWKVRLPSETYFFPHFSSLTTLILHKSNDILNFVNFFPECHLANQFPKTAAERITSCHASAEQYAVKPTSLSDSKQLFDTTLLAISFA